MSFVPRRMAPSSQPAQQQAQQKPNVPYKGTPEKKPIPGATGRLSLKKWDVNPDDVLKTLTGKGHENK